MVIAVDFDGTCVTHEFPKVGKDIGAVPILKELVKKGHKIILYTMRSHPDKNNQDKALSEEIIPNDTLQDAIDWFKENEIPLWGINENPKQKKWTSSSKIYAKLTEVRSASSVSPPAASMASFILLPDFKLTMVLFFTQPDT